MNRALLGRQGGSGGGGAACLRCRISAHCLRDTHSLTHSLSHAHCRLESDFLYFLVTRPFIPSSLLLSCSSCSCLIASMSRK